MSKKKWIIITTAMITMLLGIAGCGKNTDEEGGADVSAVTAEDLPAREGAGVNADAPGADYEENEGSAADLKKGLTAEMNGGYEGDVFHAAEILIVEVILN